MHLTVVGLAVMAMQDELVEAKYLRAPPEAGLAATATAKGRKAQKKKERTGSSAALPFRRFVSPNGLTVLVGRNNKQNDVLSHQVANPQDIWCVWGRFAVLAMHGA